MAGGYIQIWRHIGMEKMSVVNVHIMNKTEVICPVFNIAPTAAREWTRWNNMETVNCMQCDYRHKDNGNCTAVGGFCTAVPAAHCPMLRAYLNTGLTPEECINAANIIRIAFSDDTSKAERIRKLLKADEEGRLIVLPEGEKSND